MVAQEHTGSWRDGKFPITVTLPQTIGCLCSHHRNHQCCHARICGGKQQKCFNAFSGENKAGDGSQVLATSEKGKTEYNH